MKRKTTFPMVGVISAAMFLNAFCSFGQSFHQETTSPQGTYKAVFEGKTAPRNGLSQNERVRLTVTREQKPFFNKDPFFGEDGLDAHFTGAYPVIEWVNDFTLRMGGDLSAQPFHDELNVSNRTDERIDVLEIFYGRYERFLVFDLEPGKSLRIFASPQFSVSLPPASSAIYKTYNLAKRTDRVETVEGRKRQGSSEGPLSLQIQITQTGSAK
jgi:hypothetical protein